MRHRCCSCCSMVIRSTLHLHSKVPKSVPSCRVFIRLRRPARHCIGLWLWQDHDLCLQLDCQTLGLLSYTRWLAVATAIRCFVENWMTVILGSDFCHITSCRNSEVGIVMWFVETEPDISRYSLNQLSSLHIYCPWHLASNFNTFFF